MSHQLPDIQASQPDVTVGLSQVGVTGVEKLVKIARDRKRPLILMTEFRVFVDLPGGRKGIDMSRSIQVIDEVLEAAVSEPAYRVEGICGDVAKRLLAEHEYTTTAEVSMTAKLVVREGTPTSDLSTQNTAEIITSAIATDEGTREKIGVEAVGMTVCPRSRGILASRARDVLQDPAVDNDTIEEFLGKVPQPGHFQRGRATLTVETQGSPEVDLMDLIDIVRDSVLARTCNSTKHPDEDYMTYHAHANAKFVEGCVRSMAELPLEALDHLGGNAMVHMKQSNDKSIYRHNAHVEREMILRQFRDELDA